jgi:putative ABC transport system ATP-binding protein
MMDLLRAHALYRFFHKGDAETVALNGVDLALREGELVVLMGPSGSGKSTLLACLTGLDEPDGGYVTIGDDRLSRRPEALKARLRAQRMGIVLQAGNLLEHLTVSGNMALQRNLARLASASPDELLGTLGIRLKAHARPSQLSGGESARAALAVALSAQARVLVCDEPTAELDSETEADVVKLLRDQAATGRGVLVATHSEAFRHAADRVVRLEDGRITS